MSKIPVLVLAFNRVDHVIEAMKSIREYKPEKLYLECDGARIEKEGEQEAVKATQKAMLDAVDWPCEIKTLFRIKNLGCADAVNDAITWFFQNEEYGIICEDDIILSQDFFKLCEDLLLRYKDEEKIMEISARNESFRTDINNSYVFTQCYHCWGWATWRRAWTKMDMSMSAAPKLSKWYLVKRLGLFRGLMMKYYFMSAYKSLTHFNSWATRWFLSILYNDGLVICPGVNLALNIGMSSGEHYKNDKKDPLENLVLGTIDWPIKYNDWIGLDKKQKDYDNIVFAKVRWCGLKRKITYLFFNRINNNRRIGDSNIKIFIRRIACIIRTWYYFHIKWHGRVQYGGFVRVMHHTTFERKGIIIGNNVQFGPYCRVMAEVEFGSNILMASSVIFIGKNDHQFNIPCQTIWDGKRGFDSKTIVEDDVWIGHGVIILAGVTIGKGSVIAAGSVVTKNIPPCEVWGGNPARKIKGRFKSIEDRDKHISWLNKQISI